MRAMRDSGVGYLGEIPAEWGVEAFSQLFGQRNEKVADTDYAPLSVTMKGVVPQLETVAKSDDHSNRKLVRKGDFAINSRSDRRNSCGFAMQDGSVSLINTICVPRVPMESRYFGYLFATSQWADEFYSYGHGIVADLWTTGWSDMKRIPLPLPPLPEQRRIAGWLDERCASIDAAVEAARASIEEYQAYKKSVISHAVTRGLDPDAPLKDTGIRWIGEIPEHWETVPVKAVTKRRSGHTPDRKIPEYWDGDIVWVSLADSPYLRKHRYISESKNHITLAGIEHSSAEILPSGCVLLSRDATVGLCAITKTELAVSQHFMAYECGPAIYNEYLLDVFYAMNDELIGMGMGSTIPTIGLPLIRKLVTPLPPLPEQHAIAAYLDSRTAAIDAVVAQKRAIVEDLLAYKKSLIYEAVTGKREV